MGKGARFACDSCWYRLRARRYLIIARDKLLNVYARVKDEWFVRVCVCVTALRLHYTGREGNDKIPLPLLSLSLPWLRQPTTRKAPVLLPLSMHLIQLKLVPTRHEVIGQERVPFH